jgi:opacity protein-like surface antigen
MKVFASTTMAIVALAGTTWASPARAQDASAPAAPRKTTPSIEVTPFVSLDSRGATPIGAAISFPLGHSFSIESETEYRRGEGDLNALSSTANLLYALPRIGRLKPYLAAGGGLAQYGAPIVSRDGGVIGTEPRIAVEIDAGGGVKVPVTESWGMRTDARWFKSFGRNGSEHWRVSQGISFDAGKR